MGLNLALRRSPPGTAALRLLLVTHQMIRQAHGQSESGGRLSSPAGRYKGRTARDEEVIEAMDRKIAIDNCVFTSL